MQPDELRRLAFVEVAANRVPGTLVKLGERICLGEDGFAYCSGNETAFRGLFDDEDDLAHAAMIRRACRPSNGTDGSADYAAEGQAAPPEARLSGLAQLGADEKRLEREAQVVGGDAGGAGPVPGLELGVELEVGVLSDGLGGGFHDASKRSSAHEPCRDP